MGGSVLKGTVYLPFCVREWVETKYLSHCSSSSLKGSYWGISSSSQNLRNKILVSHSVMQSDTWALSASYGAILAGPDMIQPKTVFWTVGVPTGPWRRSHTNSDLYKSDPISKWIGCWLAGSESANVRLHKWDHGSKDRTCKAMYDVNRAEKRTPLTEWSRFFTRGQSEWNLQSRMAGIIFSKATYLEIGASFRSQSLTERLGNKTESRTLIE
jgi:hypothetical protein